MDRMKLFFLIAILAIGSSLVYAQSDFRKGYVITLRGDTLHGEIDYRGDRRMANQCSFRVDKNSSKQDFTAYDIQAYRFVDNKYFVSRDLDGQKYFFEYLIKGRVNIYYLRGDNAKYYIEKENSGLVELPYERGIKQLDGEANYMYESTRHMGVLNYFMQDAPALENSIASVKEPNHSSLIKIGEKYHNMVCDDEKCIIYEKKRSVRTSLELLGGLQSYSTYSFYEGLLKRSYANGGALLHINMPSENENLYLRTGIIYSKIGYYTGDEIFVDTSDGGYKRVPVSKESSLFKIPVQIEYIMGKDLLIKPKFAAGINVHTRGFLYTIAFMGGVNVRLSNSFHWSVNYDIDFDNGFFLIPKRLFSNGFSTGVLCKF